MTNFLEDTYKQMRVRPATVKFLKGAILGPHGSTLRKIQSDTGTEIQIKPEEFYNIKIKGNYIGCTQAELQIVGIIEENTFEVGLDKGYAKKLVGNELKRLKLLQDRKGHGIRVDPYPNNPKQYVLTMSTDPHNLEVSKEVVFAEIAKQLKDELKKEDKTRQFRNQTLSKGVYSAKNIESQNPANPHDFCLEIDGNMLRHEEEYTEEIENISDRKTKPLSRLSNKCGILAPYMGYMYRAEVREVVCEKDSICLRVYFTDFGNMEIVDYFSCIDLQARHLYPHKAQQLGLDKIKEDGEWSDDTLRCFRKYLKDGPLKVTLIDDVQKGVHGRCQLGTSLTSDVANDLIKRRHGRPSLGPFEPSIERVENKIGTCNAPFTRGSTGGVASVSVLPIERSGHSDLGYTFDNIIGRKMQQSIHIAYLFSKCYIEKHHQEFVDVYKKKMFHISIARLKGDADGPSYGAALALSFLSAVTNRGIPSDLCVTGEISPIGEILRVGGIREKTLTVKNNHISRFYVPSENSYEAQEYNFLQEKEVALVDVANMDSLIMDVFNKDIF